MLGLNLGWGAGRKSPADKPPVSLESITVMCPAGTTPKELGDALVPEVIQMFKDKGLVIVPEPVYKRDVLYAQEIGITEEQLNKLRRYWFGDQA